jgi:proteasome lid subunit RPN8/RPN11
LVYLDRACEEAVYPHVFANPDREVGGVLVGRVSRAGELPLVTGAIQALHAREDPAALTFTQDTWEHVHRTIERRGLEERIVGWYHSHPSFGIFLSERDLFVHRNFFGDPRQVALVVDPVSRAAGVFGWREGDVRLLFECDTPAQWRTAPAPQSVVHPSRGSIHAALTYATALLLGVLVGLAAYSFVIAGDATSRRSAMPTAKPTPAATDLQGTPPDPPAGTAEIDGP